MPATSRLPLTGDFGRGRERTALSSVLAVYAPPVITSTFPLGLRHGVVRPSERGPKTIADFFIVGPTGAPDVLFVTCTVTGGPTASLGVDQEEAIRLATDTVLSLVTGALDERPAALATALVDKATVDVLARSTQEEFFRKSPPMWKGDTLAFYAQPISIDGDLVLHWVDPRS